MKKTSLALFTATLLISSTFLHADNYVALVEILNPQSSVEKGIMASMDSFLLQMPEDKQKAAVAAIKSFADKIENDPEFKSGLVEAYKSSFSPEDVATLLEFYKTPAGAKFIEQLPTIGMETSKVGFNISRKYENDFQIELGKIMSSDQEENTPDQEE